MLSHRISKGNILPINLYVTYYLSNVKRKLIQENDASKGRNFLYDKKRVFKSTGIENSVMLFHFKL